MPRKAPVAPLTKEEGEMIMANRGLAYAVFQRFKIPRGDHDEWFSDVGVTVLARAVRSFDPTRGLRFSTYAMRGLINATACKRQRDYKRRMVKLEDSPGVDIPARRHEPAIEAEELAAACRSVLSDRSFACLSMHSQGAKLREIAAHVGLTNERARQIVKRAKAICLHHLQTLGAV